jgi:hypothetical protein
MVNFQIKYGEQTKIEKGAFDSSWIAGINVLMAVSINQLWTYAITWAT